VCGTSEIEWDVIYPARTEVILCQDTEIKVIEGGGGMDSVIHGVFFHCPLTVRGMLNAALQARRLFPVACKRLIMIEASPSASHDGMLTVGNTTS